MSQGTRIPYAEAHKIGQYVIATLMSLAAEAAERHAIQQLEVAGSMRRLKEMVGDLEALTLLPAAFEEPFEAGDALRDEADQEQQDHPAEAGKLGYFDDPLLRVLNRIVDNPFPRPARAPAVLWMPQEPEPPEPTPRVLGRAVKGLKPGFRMCQIALRPKQVPEFMLEINRATRDGYGWRLIETTGPAEFGKEFLVRWKRRHGIPFGREDCPASVKGQLVDGGGRVVSVPTEGSAFAACGMDFVRPEDRERWIERVSVEREVLR